MPSSAKKTLGPLIRVFHSRSLVWKDGLTLVLPGSVAVFAPLLYGLFRYRYAIGQFGPAAAEGWSRPWYILAVVAALIFLITAIIRIRTSRRYIAVHQNGLRLSLGRKAYLMWEEMAGVSTQATRDHFLGFSLNPHMQGVIYPNAGKPIQLTSAIQELPELLTLLKAKLYPRLLPNLQTNLHNGQWLHFGPLAIQHKGIKFIRNNTTRSSPPIPWSHVTSVNVDSGFLVVELSDQPRLKLPVSKIPNIELLLQLIQLGVNP